MTTHTNNHARNEAIEKLNDLAYEASIVAGTCARRKGDPERDLVVLARGIRDLAHVLRDQLKD